MNQEPAEFMHNQVPSENECAVCYTEFENENTKYTLDCNHSFHAECAIQWFRRGNSTCPLCRRGNPEYDIASLYCNNCPDAYRCHIASKNWEYAKFTYMKMVLKSKVAPKDLVNRFKKFDRMNEKHKESIANLTAWRKTKEYKDYLKIRSKTSILNRKVYSTRRKMNVIKMQICAYPLIPYKFNPNVLPEKKKGSRVTTATTTRPSTRSQTRINS